MPPREKGFVYLWALFAVTVAGIVMAGTGQVWQVKSQREKEVELLYIGEQFRNAVMSYYNSSTGAAKEYPKSLEDLLLDTRTPAIKRHLRKIYLDPMTNTADWEMVEEPAPNTGSLASSSASGRIIGVHSLSEKKPIKKDKFPEHFAKFSEAKTYRDWQFTYKPGSANASGAPAPTSNQPKPGAAPGSPGAAAGSSSTASPFAPQSSSATGAARPSSTGSTSPFAPQSSPSTDSKSPPLGFPSSQ